MAKKTAQVGFVASWTKNDVKDGDGQLKLVGLRSDGVVYKKTVTYKHGVTTDGEWTPANVKLNAAAGADLKVHAAALTSCKAMAGYVLDGPPTAEAAKPTAPEAKGNGSSENVTKCDVCGKEHKGFTTGRACSTKDCPGTVRAPNAPKATEKPVEAPAAKSTTLVPCRGVCGRCDTAVKMPSTDGLTVTCQSCKKGTVTMKAIETANKTMKAVAKQQEAMADAKAKDAPKAPNADEPAWAPPDGAWTVGDLLRALGVSKIDPLANRTRLTVAVNEDLSTVYGLSFGQFEALDGHSYYAMTLEGKLPKDPAPADDHAVTSGTLPFPAAKGNTAGFKKGKK